MTPNGKMKKLLLALLLLASAPLCSHATPFIIKDINLAQPNSTVRELCSELTELNGHYYFCGDDSSGEELWRTDGSEEGTELVADIRVGSGDSSPRDLTVFNEKLYFITDVGDSLYRLADDRASVELIKDFFDAYIVGEIDGKLLLVARGTSSGLELWISDGTTDGTELLKDISAGSSGSFGSFVSKDDFVKLNDKIYFSADDGINGVELWVTEGTAISTKMVNTIDNGDALIVQFGTKVLFRGDRYGDALWITDGTDLGTLKLTDATDGSFTFCGAPLVIGSKALFCFSDSSNTGRELWVTDGTVEGTSLLLDINTGLNGSSNPEMLATVNGKAYFVASDTLGTELWSSDGSVENTQKITSRPGVFHDAFFALGESDGELLFVADMPSVGISLWKTSAVDSSVIQVKDFDSNLGAYGASGSSTELLGTIGRDVYFTLDIEVNQPRSLWKTDGTESGTTKVGDFPVLVNLRFKQDTKPRFFSGFSDVGFFAAGDPNLVGVERIWRANVAGTSILKELTPADLIQSRSTVFSEFAEMDNSLFFLTRSSPTSSSSVSLWKSDGTAQGTVFIKQVCDNFCDITEAEIVATENQVFILIDSEILWRSDGTVDGTVELKTVGDSRFLLRRPSKLTPFGNTVFFVGWDSANKKELWVSDGTVLGTKVVKNIDPRNSGSGFANSESDTLEQLSDFAILNGVLYFAADDGVHGAELWRSGGTDESTFMVKDIFSNPRFPGQGSFPQDITAAGNTLFFSAFTLNGGYELWKSNGTAAGTSLVKDIEPALFSSGLPVSSLPKGFLSLGNKAVFRAYKQATGYETWVSDGTKKGTFMLKEILPGGFSSSSFLSTPPTNGDFPEDLTNIRRLKEGVVLNNELFFVANQRLGGSELWKTDGTRAGTVLVKQIALGEFSAVQIGNITFEKLNGKLFYFAMSNGSNQTKLWQSDGTSQGTVIVEDHPQTPLVNVSRVISFNSNVFFTADNGIKGVELWATKPDSDRDGLSDSDDNCLVVANPDQANNDLDVFGDVCDPDDDNDNVRDSVDAFPFDDSESLDTDKDGIGNNADPDDDNDMVNDVDGSGEPLDNCPLIANPSQEDSNNNGEGDACEDSQLCLPIIAGNGAIAVICL